MTGISEKENWVYIPPSKNDNKTHSQAYKFLINEYWKEAVEAYEQEVNQNPEDNQALHYLGVALVAGRQNYQDFQKGVGYIHQSVLKDSKNYKYIHNFAHAAFEVKHYETARQMYEACLQIKPDYKYALMGLITIYLLQNEVEKALPILARLLKIDPQDEQIRFKQAEVALENCQFEEAEKITQGLILDYPYFVNAHLKLAGIYTCQGKDHLALKTYIQALRICEDEPVLKLNLGLTLMAQRKLRAGGRYYRARYDLPKKEIVPSHIQTPVWRGENLEEKTLFLYREQGFGDMINFIRFLPEILTKFNPKKIYFCTDARLIALFKNAYSDPRIDWIDDIKNLQSTEYDFHAPLVEAMLNLGVNYAQLDNFQKPYLRPSHGALQKWNDILKASPKKKIGICWSGNKIHENNHNRSMHADQFMEIFKDLDHAHFDLYTLLIGAQNDDSIQAFIKENKILDVTADLKDFNESAAMIQHLDLVITVDTAAAHLAGAMGKEVWVLIPYNNDWRWFEQRFETTKWYPSMRLFRQKSYKDWGSVIDRVKEALENF